MLCDTVLMDTISVLAQIDAEIAKLQQARAVLAGNDGVKGITAAAPKKKAMRRLSAEARKRIADAQRARWAKVKAKK